MHLLSVSVALITSLVFVASAYAVDIAIVPIGDPGNPPDTRYSNPNVSAGWGAVANLVHMGATEVTNAQYVEFLNAVAASDSYELYNPLMTSDSHGGIIRSGLPGTYFYNVKPAAIGKGPGGTDYVYDNKPVVFVSWFDAIRFANWLDNGQGAAGTTEDGSYTLLGGTTIPSNGNVVTRNPGAHWVIPTEDEWYKAAYYNPVTGDYYDWPAGTNMLPDNNLPSADSGNSMNIWIGGDSTTGDFNYPMTDVGAYQNSGSPYGTFDQGGNVYEWNESLLGNRRGVRGGSWQGRLLTMLMLQLGLPRTQRLCRLIPEQSVFALP
jgi:formylglycine-generating enzyme